MLPTVSGKLYLKSMQTYEKFMEMRIYAAWSQTFRGRYDVLERESKASSRKFEYFWKKWKRRWGIIMQK